MKMVNLGDLTVLVFFNGCILPLRLSNQYLRLSTSMEIHLKCKENAWLS